MKLRKPFKETQWISRRVERAVRCRIKEQDFKTSLSTQQGFPGGSVSKESACNAGDVGSTLGREDHLEKGMATSVFLSGESPRTEEPGRLQSIGSQRVRHDWRDWASTNPLNTVIVVDLVQAGSCTSHGSTGWQLKLYARDMKDMRMWRFEDMKLVPVTFLNVWLMSSAATTAFWYWKMSQRLSIIGNTQICMLFKSVSLLDKLQLLRHFLHERVR